MSLFAPAETASHFGNKAMMNVATSGLWRCRISVIATAATLLSVTMKLNPDVPGRPVNEPSRSFTVPGDQWRRTFFLLVVSSSAFTI